MLRWQNEKITKQEFRCFWEKTLNEQSTENKDEILKELRQVISCLMCCPAQNIVLAQRIKYIRRATGQTGLVGGDACGFHEDRRPAQDRK